MENFDLINVQFGTNKGHLFSYEDHCLYVKNGVSKDFEGNSIQYYTCWERMCTAKGRVIKGKFNRTTTKGAIIPPHNHLDHKLIRDTEKALYEAKLDASNAGTKPLRKVFLDNLKRKQRRLLSETKYESHERTMRRIRAKKFPSCRDISTLDDLLKNNEDIRKKFGMFEHSEFYQGTVGEGESIGAIFVLEQLTSELEGGFDMFVDGTFGVLPLTFNQLLIVLAEVEGKVFCTQ